SVVEIRPSRITCRCARYCSRHATTWAVVCRGGGGSPPSSTSVARSAWSSLVQSWGGVLEDQRSQRWCWAGLSHSSSSLPPHSAARRSTQPCAVSAHEQRGLHATWSGRDR